MNWRRWPWLEEGILPLSVLLLRLFWLWPWLLLLSRWMLPPELRPVMPFWLVVALLLGAALATRFLPLDLERMWRKQAMVAGLGLLVMALVLWWTHERADYALWDLRWLANQGVILTHWNDTLPPSVMIVALVAYLWLRGIQDSTAPNHDEVWRGFGIGLLALVLLLIASHIDPSGPIPSNGRWIVLFFVTGMSALALAGLRLSRSSRNPAGPLPISRYWLASVVTIVAFLVVAGLILGFLITPEWVASVTGWVRIVIDWIALVLGYLLYAIVYVLFLALTPLILWFENYIATRTDFDPERLQGMERGLFESAREAPTTLLPEAVDESARWVGLVVGFAVLALLFATALRIMHRRQGQDEDELRETVLSQELLRGQASSLFQRLRNVLTGGRQNKLDPFLSLNGETDSRRRIRAAYQAFLGAMIDRGKPRSRRQTPSKFADSMSAYMNTALSALRLLTAKYESARYDVQDPPTADAVRAEEAWSILREHIEELNDVDYSE